MTASDYIFQLPDLGEGLEEAEIVAWHVGVGDRVVADQPLVAVETDKAVVEVPSPIAGVIAKLLVAAGDIAAVGAPLVAFGAAGADAGAIVGDLDRQEPAPTAVDRPAVKPSPRKILAAPAARAAARAADVDLASVEPTGVARQVALADVKQAARRAVSPVASDAGGLRGPRRAMARAMTRARDRISPATVTDMADVEAWVTPKADITVRLIRALAVAAAAEPTLNAWYDDEAMRVDIQPQVDIGLAVDTPDGLFVPVLRGADAWSPDEMRTEIDRMHAAVRARRATPDDLRAPTLTLSNFGVIAGIHAQLVVNPPQVAILGAGRIGPAWVDRDGEAAVCRCLPLSLTFDHRVVTGGEAARFLRATIDDLERKT